MPTPFFSGVLRSCARPPRIPAALTRQLSDFPTNRQADKLASRQVGKRPPYNAEEPPRIVVSSSHTPQSPAPAHPPAVPRPHARHLPHLFAYPGVNPPPARSPLVAPRLPCFPLPVDLTRLPPLYPHHPPRPHSPPCYYCPHPPAFAPPRLPPGKPPPAHLRAICCVRPINPCRLPLFSLTQPVNLTRLNVPPGARRLQTLPRPINLCRLPPATRSLSPSYPPR